MKSKPRARRNQDAAAKSRHPGAPSARRQRWFRVAAITLIPALFFACLELGLRLIGYGHPTSFFRQLHIGDRTVYVENDRFGLRFFPKSLVRIPPPLVFPAAKGTNTCRIFVLGESAALGDPEPAFGLGRYLEVLLRERFPGTEFEVVNAAMTAINSHALLPIARDCANHAGDLWVIYMGNNEVVGPFGAGTILGAQSPPILAIRASLAVQTTRLGQLLNTTLAGIGAGPAPPKNWQGMEMFTNAKTRPEETKRHRTNEHFRKNLAAILRTAKASGVPVILCTVATNLKDCAPFASLHSANLTDRQRGEWESHYRAGNAFQSAEKWPEALARYREAEALDGAYADLQYRLGHCYLAAGESELARRCFEKARDFDALPFRATSTLNTLIQETGREFAGAGVVLWDADKALAQASPEQISGAELFYEHVHLNFAGNYRLARGVAEVAATLLPQCTAHADSAEWPGAAICDERLGVTPWDRARVYENVLQRETQPPFTSQSDHAQQVEKLSRELRTHRSLMNTNNLATARSIYRQALQQRPNDFILHGNYAKLLEDTGDLPGAVAAWQRVRDQLPYHFGPDYYLGKLLARLGRLEEAHHCLSRTVTLRPDAVDALVELGRVLVRQNKAPAGLDQFDRALALQPENARLHFHRAEAQAAQGQQDAAIASLQRAIQLRPAYWEARYLLGVELAIREHFSAAREQFSEVVRLRPDHVLAHLNLGIALAKENRLSEAVEQFRETLRLDPANQIAREYLSKLRAARPAL